MYKGDPTSTPQGIRLDPVKRSAEFSSSHSRGFKSWRTHTSTSPLKDRTSKTVYYALSIRFLDDVKSLDLDLLRTSFSTILDDTNERDIRLAFDQETDYVVMSLVLDRSVETGEDLISAYFIKQVNKAFTETGAYNISIKYGYLAKKVDLYYRIDIARGFTFDDMEKNALSRAFLRVFGNRGYKNIQIQIKSIGNSGQIRVELDIASKNVESVTNGLLQRGFQNSLNQELQEERLTKINITDASMSEFQFLNTRTHGVVTVCYALNNKIKLWSRNTSSDHKIIQCFSELLDDVMTKDLKLSFSDQKSYDGMQYTEMKIVVDNLSPRVAKDVEWRLLSVHFQEQLNALLSTRGLYQYTVKKAYLEDKRGGIIMKETKEVTEDYEELNKDDKDWWMYGYIACAFLLWFIPFILCTLLLSTVHSLQTEVDGLRNDMIALHSGQSTGTVGIPRIFPLGTEN